MSNRFFKILPSTPTNSSRLRLSADNDFISYLILHYYDSVSMPSCSMWLALHTVEKYLKSWILLKNPEYNIVKNGHKIKKIWDDLEKTDSANEIFKYPEISQFIEELNTLQHNIRYADDGFWRSPDFLALFVIICNYFRFETQPKDFYKPEDYNYGLGLYDSPLKFDTNKSYEYETYSANIILKMLHIIVEHKIIVSNSTKKEQRCGIYFNFYPDELKKYSYKESLKNCYICNNPNFLENNKERTYTDYSLLKLNKDFINFYDESEFLKSLI